MILDDISRVHGRLDSMDQRLDSIDKTLAVQSKELAAHIEQTNILRKEVQPIAKSHTELMGIYKFIGFLGLLAAIGEGLSVMRIRFF